MSIAADYDQNQDLFSRSRAVTISFFWPGIIAFMILLGLSLVGLWYYARSKQRSLMFWIVGIVVCVVVSYIIATFALTPLLLGLTPHSSEETFESIRQFSPPVKEEDTKDNLVQIYCLALDSFMPLDEALNHDMKYIAIDTTTMTDITEEGKKQIVTVHATWHQINQCQCH